MKIKMIMGKSKFNWLRLIGFIFSSVVVFSGCVFSSTLWGSEIIQTIQHIKPSIVGIGTFQITRSPPAKIIGTGFVVGDGLTVVTNAHVILGLKDGEKKETLGIFTGIGGSTKFTNAMVVNFDKEHDLAQLKFGGAPLPVMEIGDSNAVQEGQSFVFTGFPLGMSLGFYPVTHNGMISSITPVVMPAINASVLDAKRLVQLKKSSFFVFQLDGTAYPGGSGSPLYDPETGVVYGVISMVLIKELKESALSQPSGISYAIPSNHIRELLLIKQP